MELDRIQLNEDGSTQPILNGYVANTPNDFQNWVDNRQEILDSSDNKFLKAAGQPVQDVQNMIAHPIKTSQSLWEQFRKSGYNPWVMTGGMGYQTGKALAPQEDETGGDYAQRLLGTGLGSLSLGLVLGGKPTVKSPTLNSTIANIKYKPNYPVKGSLGGDKINISPDRRSLGFYADLLEKSGMSKEQARATIRKGINRNVNLPEGKQGGYNQVRNEINIRPNSQFKRGSSLDALNHEEAHRTLSILENLDKNGLATPETSEFLHKLKQSQSDKLTPLAENEAISRAFEQLRNPNLRFTDVELQNLMINPEDITNAYKVLKPYYRTYRGLNNG